MTNPTREALRQLAHACDLQAACYPTITFDDVISYLNIVGELMIAPQNEVMYAGIKLVYRPPAVTADIFIAQEIGA